MAGLVVLQNHGVASRLPPATENHAHAEAIAAELRGSIEGEVRFDTGSRALYATDASNYRRPPIGVVIPRSLEDVVATVAVARKYGAPILSRGAGTSLAGQCCNFAIVMDFSKYLHDVLSIDAQQKLATVSPGCVLDDLRDAAAEHSLTFGPDPATHKHCTLGGMLGNNSCGVHSLLSAKYGMGLRTSDNTHELEVLTYGGEKFRVGPTSEDELDRIIRAGGAQGDIYARLRDFRNKYAKALRGMPKLPRRVSGYNLDALLPESNFHVARALVGSESTLVTILEATVHLVPKPKAKTLLVLGYEDAFSAGDHVTDILPFQPTGLEGLDSLLIQYIQKKGDHDADLRLLPEGEAFLMVEFDGETQAEADEQARRCMETLRRRSSPPSMKLFDNQEEEEQLWRVREGGLGATAFVPGLPDMWPGWEDSAVPPEKVGDYLRGLRKLFDKYGYNPSVYGHFGQGCIHCRIDFDLYTEKGIRHWRSFLDEAADLVAGHGGSLSGEHGDGQARGELLSKMYGPELMEAFREFKAIWDPDGKMNPGKMIDAQPITSDLRLGTDYEPPNTRTYFRFPDDRGDFARAVLRCVGVGKCCDHSGHTMCPSYQATREEQHSTRGRARLLWEMLNGDVLRGGWKSEPVKEALDLCLACKGCKSDCPVNVDMATYKAEFLAHYYKKRRRPRQAYAFGFIHRWAHLASLAPRLANSLSQAPGVHDIVRWAARLAPERQLPRFAPQSFQRWHARRPAVDVTGPEVILWPDTFCNYFHPEIAQAAVAALEQIGFRVTVPRSNMCCGRPLYDYGFLDAARSWLRDIILKLRSAIEFGLPVIVLEPSCAAVFKDELVNLFPDDRLAVQLSKQTFLLSEFLEQHVPNLKVPQLGGQAIVHGHCHQKALVGFESEKHLLKRMGLMLSEPELGCCGMAGSFGFEEGEHYSVSRTCGERALLPAVRGAGHETLIIADGFSCREQIRQCTSRSALHTAQVLHNALTGSFPNEPDFKPGQPTSIST